MNYEPNTRQWQPGDLVIHDADAKEHWMLMQVLGYDKKTGWCRTKYLYPGHYDGMRKKPMLNELRFLHDPAQFGVQAQNALLPIVKCEQI